MTQEWNWIGQFYSCRCCVIVTNQRLNLTWLMLSRTYFINYYCFYEIPKFLIQSSIFFFSICCIFSHNAMVWLALCFTNGSICALNKWTHEYGKLCFKVHPVLYWDQREKSFSPQENHNFFLTMDPTVIPWHLAKVAHFASFFKTALLTCNLT